MKAEEGDYAGAEPLLRQVINPVQQTLAADSLERLDWLINLCFVLIMQDKLKEASTVALQAWALNASHHTQNGARVLLLRLAIAFLQSQGSEVFIGQLKTLFIGTQPLEAGKASRVWSFVALIASVRSKLCAAESDLLRVGFAVLNDAGGLAELEMHQLWCDQRPMPLDVLWHGLD